MTEGSNYDYLFKVHLTSLILAWRWLNLHTQQVVLIGDSGVGKSFVFELFLFAKANLSVSFVPRNCTFSYRL